MARGRLYGYYAVEARVAGLVASLVFVCWAEFSLGPSSNRKQLVRPSTGHHGEKMCGQPGHRHSVGKTAGEILISGVKELHILLQRGYFHVK